MILGRRRRRGALLLFFTSGSVWEFLEMVNHMSDKQPNFFRSLAPPIAFKFSAFSAFPEAETEQNGDR